jgi:hypothetical protein
LKEKQWQQEIVTSIIIIQARDDSDFTHVDTNGDEEN